MATGEQFFYINNRIIDVRGLAVGAQVYFYLTGTMSLRTVYADVGLTTPLANPYTVAAGAAIPNIYLDPTITYRVRIIATTGQVIDDLDPYDPINADTLTFIQSGTGAEARSIQDKNRDTVSVKDFGAVGDGTTPAQTAFTYAATSLTAGGLIDIPAGTYKVGEQFFGPSRGNVHTYDVAVIGTTDVLTNGIFMGSPATGWTLAQVSSTNPGITHIAGLSASAKRTVPLKANTNYLVKVTLTTTTAGGITFYVDGVALLSGVDYFGVPVGSSVVYRFPYLRLGATGDVDLEFRSDTAWAGSVSKIEVIQITKETPYDFFGIPSDNKAFGNNFGVKFGRYLSGNIAIGDRATGALLSTTAAWNVLIGSRAGSVIVDEIECTFIGDLAGEYNQANQITSVGYSALRCNTTGTFNAALGFKALGLNTTGARNAALGHFAVFANSIGSDNTGGGYQALYQDALGSFNSAWGSQAGLQMKNGSGNSYFGAGAGPYNVDSNITFLYNSQTLVGSGAFAWGDGNTALGANTRVGSDPNAAGTAVTNSTAIGAGALCAADNQVTLGNTSVTEVRTAGYLQANNNDAVPAGGSALIGLKLTSVANLGFFVGSGAPTLSAAKGSLYTRTDGSSTSTRVYVNTDGGTTWTNLVTAA